jgi:hypothetical protein
MADRLGRNVGAYIGVEDSYGAGQGTPKLFGALGRSTLRLSPVQTVTQTPEIRPDPNPAEPVRDIIDLNAELAQLCSVDSAPFMLKLLLGNSVKTGASAPWLWTSKVVSNALLSAIIEKWDSVESKSDLIKGALLSSLKISWRKRGGALIFTWGFTGIGAAPIRNSTRFDAAPTAWTAKRHSMAACTITVDGAATLAPFIVAFDAALNFAVERRDGATGNAFADAIDPGACAITASIQASRPTADSIYALCDGADHIFVFTSPQPGTPTRYFKFTMSQVRVEKVNPTDESGAGMVTEPFDLLPYFTTHADGTAAKFEVANDVTAY